jgi:hypothetical protein
VFTSDGSTWTQAAELSASDGASSNYLGYSVAIGATGDMAIAGAFGHNGSAGAAYVFTTDGSTWTQNAELTAPDGSANDSFGAAVAIEGGHTARGVDIGTAIVGGFGHNGGTGAAYVFTSDGSTWTQAAELSASDGASNDYFGISVAMGGSHRAIVGAQGHAGSTGAAYVLAYDGSTWTQVAELTASDGAANDYLGISVAMSESQRAIVGASGHNGSAGAAYVFSGATAVTSP